MPHPQLGGHTGFFHGGHIDFGRRVLFALFDKGSHYVIALSRQGRHRMPCRDCDVGCPHQSVWASRKYGKFVRRIVLSDKVDFCAFRPADPVALHALDRLRPTGHIVQVIEQFFGVVGDL